MNVVLAAPIMGQINPFSGYPAEPVSLDHRSIGDREGGQPRRNPQRQKLAPQPQAEDQVELHSDAEETPVLPEPTLDDADDGHVDVTA
jgi:hypothetical protein